MKSKHDRHATTVVGISFTLISVIIICVPVRAQQIAQRNFDDLPRIRITDHRGQEQKKPFPRFGQCQMKFTVSLRKDQTNTATQRQNLRRRLADCFEVARSEGVNVLILPELALSVPEQLQREIITEAKNIAEQNKMIIIAGSYYDEGRRNTLLVIGDTWMEAGYKVRPSRYEVSPISGEGMTPGESVLVLRTVYGTFAIITCVDLISDDVQYLVRRLATRSDIDVLININYNPASWEFLIEANSIVRRHPIFASITSVGNSTPKQECVKDSKSLVDNGTCYGNTAVFANLRSNPDDAPNNADRISEALPSSFTYTYQTQRGPKTARLLPYDSLVAVITPFREAMLIYDLNLSMPREPLTTNAPDPGYPTIKNVKIVDLKLRTP